MWRSDAATSSCSEPSSLTTSMPSRAKAAHAVPGSPATLRCSTRSPRASSLSMTARVHESSSLTMARSPAPRLAKTFSLAAA